MSGVIAVAAPMALALLALFALAKLRRTRTNPHELARLSEDEVRKHLGPEGNVDVLKGGST